MNEQQFYYLSEACTALSRRLGEPFDESRLFSLAEQGMIAIGVRVGPSRGELFFGSPEEQTKKTFFLNSVAIHEFSPNQNNFNQTSSVYAYTSASQANDLNRQDCLGVRCSESEEASTTPLSDVKKTELIVTSDEIERFIHSRSTEKDLNDSTPLESNSKEERSGLTYLPTNYVKETLNSDPENIKRAIQILNIADSFHVHREHSAIDHLLDYWTETKQLKQYLDGKPVDLGSLMISRENIDEGFRYFSTALAFDPDALNRVLTKHGFPRIEVPFSEQNNHVPTETLSQKPIKTLNRPINEGDFENLAKQNEIKIDELNRSIFRICIFLSESDRPLTKESVFDHLFEETILRFADNDKTRYCWEKANGLYTPPIQKRAINNRVNRIINLFNNAKDDVKPSGTH